MSECSEELSGAPEEEGYAMLSCFSSISEHDVQKLMAKKVIIHRPTKADGAQARYS